MILEGHCRFSCVLCFIKYSFLRIVWPFWSVVKLSYASECYNIVADDLFWFVMFVSRKCIEGISGAFWGSDFHS
jgi:hypothetical protein